MASRRVPDSFPPLLALTVRSRWNYNLHDSQALHVAYNQILLKLLFTLSRYVNYAVRDRVVIRVAQSPVLTSTATPNSALMHDRFFWIKLARNLFIQFITRKRFASTCESTWRKLNPKPFAHRCSSMLTDVARAPLDEREVTEFKINRKFIFHEVFREYIRWSELRSET